MDILFNRIPSYLHFEGLFQENNCLSRLISKISLFCKSLLDLVARQNSSLKVADTHKVTASPTPQPTPPNTVIPTDYFREGRFSCPSPVDDYCTNVSERNQFNAGFIQAALKTAHEFMSDEFKQKLSEAMGYLLADDFDLFHAIASITLIHFIAVKMSNNPCTELSFLYPNQDALPEFKQLSFENQQSLIERMYRFDSLESFPPPVHSLAKQMYEHALWITKMNCFQEALQRFFQKSATA